MAGTDDTLSSFLNDGFSSGSVLANMGGRGGSKEPEKDGGGGDGFGFSGLAPMKPSPRSALAERAARAGFSAPTINTASIRSAARMGSSSEARSPYLTIPAGLSPTMLLESPVFLSNAMGQPSPTTGKFLFEQYNNTNSDLIRGDIDKGKDQPLEDVVPESFAFKPLLETNSSYFPSAENKDTSSIEHQQSLPSIEVSVQSEEPGLIDLKDQQRVHAGFSDISIKKDTADDITFSRRISGSFIGNEHSSPPQDEQTGEGDPKGEFSSVAVGAPADDGYNWRKYGQKQVKGSEYPRSYYKCTHPNCPVKKKVERSHEGHITEIIYKGAHSHPKPPPNRRSGISAHSFSDMQLDGSEHPGSQSALDGKLLYTNTQEWRNGPEAIAASVPAECIDPSAMSAHDGSRFELSDAIDVSSTLSNDEDEDDQATHGSVSLGGEGEGDETESKRRKLDTCAMDMSASSRAVREPRVVVQTTSEVDILDDGYRWRKYGQKVVKGNPNPRSYYKCTNPGCSVRKHVERASHDLKSVITTYEGKHNHEVPAARNSGHTSSGPSSTAVTSASQSHNFHRRPDPVQVQDLMRFDNPAALHPYSLPGREQLGPSAGFPFGMGQQGLNNFAIAGINHVTPLKIQNLPPAHHPYMVYNGQATEGGYMVPKGEPKEESIPEAGLPMPNGASFYYQIMDRIS